MMIKATKSLIPISQRTVRVSNASFSKVYPAPQAAAARSSIIRANPVEGFQEEDIKLCTLKV